MGTGVGTGLPASRKDPSPRPSPALVPTRVVWTLALNSPLSAPPAYDAVRAFFPLDRDRVVAYDIVSGKQLWLVEARPAFQPATGNDLLFLADAEGISALNVADGSEAWRLPLPEPIVVQPVWDNGWLIALTKENALALRATDGHLVWRRDLGAAPHAPAALAADRVYIPQADGRIVALNVTDGTPAWERRVGGQPNEILAGDDRLYVGSTDNFFYCLLAKDGRIDWRWRTGADVMGKPAADDERVYFVSFDNVLRALNRSTGGQQWMRALPIRPTSGPSFGASTVLVVGHSAAIRAFAAKDGTPAPDIDAGNEVAAPPHFLAEAFSGLPMILFVTTNISKGATAMLQVRTMEPTQIPAVAPLPNAVTPAPMPVTR